MTTIISEGLLELPWDSRDFNLGKIDEVKIRAMPVSYEIEDLLVESQGSTDFCTGFAITKASEVQEGMRLNPLYQFAKTKEISGNWDRWGANLRDACKSAVKFGSIEQSIAPYDITTPRKDLHWEKWDIDYDTEAMKHRKKSYFSVDRGDVYEDIKYALWKYNSPVMTGTMWRHAWTRSEDGIIPEYYTPEGFGHAFLFTGWKVIEGTEYLIAHSSNGIFIGDEGRFYFPKHTVEREIGRYGLFVFIDLDPEDYKRDKWSRYQKIINFIIRLRNKYVKK